METERDKILAMVEEGTISAEEAEELLAALYTPAATAEGLEWPELRRRADDWQKPFNAALFASLLSTLALLATRDSDGLLRFFRRFLLWPMALISALAALVTFFAKDGPWLHVRVESADGQTINISMPVPTRAVHKALQIASSRAPNQDVREKIDAAAEILAEMEPGKLRDPLVIDINDEGDHVQIYLN